MCMCPDERGWEEGEARRNLFLVFHEEYKCSPITLYCMNGLASGPVIIQC